MMTVKFLPKYSYYKKYFTAFTCRYKVADPGNSKRGERGPGAVEFLGLGFVLMPLHTYPMCL